jgi:hypothetical protein
MLRGTHDHHRDIPALASAPCTTALHSTNPEKFAVTWHGLHQFPPAAPLLRPTLQFASSLVSNVAKLPLAGNPHWHASDPATIRAHRITSRGATADRDFDTLSRKQKYP